MPKSQRQTSGSKALLLALLATAIVVAGCGRKEPVASATQSAVESEKSVSQIAADSQVAPDPQVESEPPVASDPQLVTDSHEEAEATAEPDAASDSDLTVEVKDPVIPDVNRELQVNGSEDVESATGTVAEETDSDPLPVSPFRLLLPTTEGPLVVDLEIVVGDQPLNAAFAQRLESIMEEAAGEDGLTWDGLLEHIQSNPQQFGRSRIDAQQYRNMIRMYDRNRNSRPELEEVAKFLFRDTGFSGPFRMAGSNFYRQINRSQSPMFLAIDRNGNHTLEADEISLAYESLSRLDQNGDRRIDITEIMPATTVNNRVNEAWSNRRKSRWGDVAMDLGGYVDWSMVSYALDESSHDGVFHSGTNAVAGLDQNEDDSIDRDEARRLLEVPSDLRIQIQFSSSVSSKPQIEAELATIDSGVSDPSLSVEFTDDGEQVRIATDRFQLVASVNDLRIGRNTIPREAFNMLDADNDGGLDETEIPAAALQEYSFEDLDQDENGKLSYQEITEGLNPILPIWSVQIRSRGAETPDAVFAWLDQDQNHVLSTRELLACSERLQRIASDEGSIRANDFPDSFLIQFGRGDPQQDEQLFALSQRLTKRAPGWPSWAESMDANQDGDISRREFLGRRDQFDPFDKNQDGFLSQQELRSPQ